MDYAQDFDLDSPFFTQFQKLMLAVPRMQFVREGTIVNSDYCNRVSYAKNCYLLFSSNINEDCYYGTRVENCKNCMDCYGIYQSELTYRCIDCSNCYQSAWLQNCTNCSDSYFLHNCSSCKHCLLCTNLNQKEYCILNKQYTKEEYERELSRIDFGSHTTIESLSEHYRNLNSQLIVKEYNGFSNENFSGNYLDHCKNAHECFDCREAEDVRYCQSVTGAKNCMDYSYWGLGVERVYETHACGIQCQDILFCNECWEGNSNILYCDSCIGCSHLFGCVGLKKKRYCILNKQYTKEEYEALVPMIIRHIRKTKEWGEFFPAEINHFSYNETVAQDYFPLDKQKTAALGYKWLDEEEKTNQYLGPSIEIPDAIDDVDDSICSTILQCEVTKKPYKVIPQELAFYRLIKLPISRKCPDMRHKERMALRNPRQLGKRQCENCNKEIETTYSPQRPEKVFCESCYFASIY